MGPAVLISALDAGVPLGLAQGWLTTPTRTTEHYDRARGNVDRHGVYFHTRLRRRRMNLCTILVVSRPRQASRPLRQIAARLRPKV